MCDITISKFVENSKDIGMTMLKINLKRIRDELTYLNKKNTSTNSTRMIKQLFIVYRR